MILIIILHIYIYIGHMKVNFIFLNIIIIFNALIDIARLYKKIRINYLNKNLFNKKLLKDIFYLYYKTY